MNLGLIIRSLRETWAITLVFAGFVGGFSALLAYVLPGVQERFMKRAFIPPQVMQIRNAILGVDGSASGVAEIAFGLAWSHPVILALLFAHAIIYTTRVPAGEVERGTMDILLGLPVSRWGLHASETAAWVLSAVFLLGSMFVGSYLGAQFIKVENRPDWGVLAIVLGNLACVYAAAGAAGMLCASSTNRRTRAVLTVLIVLVASMLIYWLREMWEPAETFGFLSPLYYYRPAPILRSGEWPWKDMGVLIGACVVLWVAAGMVLNRRALTTT